MKALAIRNGLPMATVLLCMAYLAASTVAYGQPPGASQAGIFKQWSPKQKPPKRPVPKQKQRPAWTPVKPPQQSQGAKPQQGQATEAQRWSESQEDRVQAAAHGSGEPITVPGVGPTLPAAYDEPVAVGEPVEPVAETAIAGVIERSGLSGYSNITIRNGTDRYALVVLSGPTRAEIGVLPNSSETIDSVAPGTYTIYVRFGSGSACTYERGEPFVVSERRYDHAFGYRIVYSNITIGLRTTVNGNYETEPIDATEFERARAR